MRQIPEMSDGDIALVMQALAVGTRRVEPVSLSCGIVWIKRYGREGTPFLLRLHGLSAKLVPWPFMRPSPLLGAQEMVSRETRRIEAFRRQGFPVPAVVHASAGALVLTDAGETVKKVLDRLKNVDPPAHDALLVRCAAALGRLHAAGLCHGRPHTRDMFDTGEAIGFMDFEEEPEAVMPLETAQARDLWLLFLQVASTAAFGRQTCDAAYDAWADVAPAAARRELQVMMRTLARLLPLSRLIGRVHMGSDLRRFIMATDYLKDISPTVAVRKEHAQGRKT